MTATAHIQTAHQVQAIRARTCITQEELARRVGCSLRTVQRWEAGAVKPSRLARRRLARL